MQDFNIELINLDGTILKFKTIYEAQDYLLQSGIQLYTYWFDNKYYFKLIELSSGIVIHDSLKDCISYKSQKDALSYGLIYYFNNLYQILNSI